jgi:hypothetical protein
MHARNKGCGGEREVCKLLAEWWQPYEPDCVFVRTPGSGGWGGGSFRHRLMKADMHSSGDIMTTAKRFPFSVEVKRNESWSEKQLAGCRTSPVWKWWIQAQRQASNDGLLPLLFFRKNRRPWNIFVPQISVLDGVEGLMRYHASYAIPKGCILGINFGNVAPLWAHASDLLGLPPKEVGESCSELFSAK